MTKRTQAQLLAETFATILKDVLNEEDWREMKRRNRTPDYHGSGVCASHDFCDANMVMFSAFKEVVGREPSLNSATDTDLWSKAWDIANQSMLS